MCPCHCSGAPAKWQVDEIPRLACGEKLGASVTLRLADTNGNSVLPGSSFRGRPLLSVTALESKASAAAAAASQSNTVSPLFDDADAAVSAAAGSWSLAPASADHPLRPLLRLCPGVRAAGDWTPHIDPVTCSITFPGAVRRVCQLPAFF